MSHLPTGTVTCLFTDIAGSTTPCPVYPYVEAVYTNGIMRITGGYADCKFRQTASASRGQVAKILVQAAGWLGAIHINCYCICCYC